MGKTIEERASNFGWGTYGNVEDLKQGYIQGATDQDPISRADERRKVIDKTWDWMKEYFQYEQLGNGVGLNDKDKEEFYKAMKG